MGAGCCEHCCGAAKPPRAHHCRHTGRCILRLDHFCIFADCAIGAGNIKYFLLWQIYQLLSCLQMVRLNYEAVAAGEPATNCRCRTGSGARSVYLSLCLPPAV